MKEIRQLTFEAACKLEKVDPKKSVPDFNFFPKEDRKAMIAHAKIVIMIKAANRLANGGKPWKPDYTDGQIKYEPRFWYEKKSRGSSGFRYDGFAGWDSGSHVGSRLSFFNYDTMTDMAVHNKHYLKLWNE